MTNKQTTASEERSDRAQVRASLTAGTNQIINN